MIHVSCPVLLVWHRSLGGPLFWQVSLLPGISGDEVTAFAIDSNQWEISRILKWRYCAIFLAIFCGDIPLHRPQN